MITPETVEKILDATRVEEVVGDFVRLKKRGVSLIGLCPFHNEKTPSFHVSPVKGIFKCFGCGKAGSAVSFLMEHEHYSYPDALRYLARKYRIEIEEERPSPEQQEALNEKESLYNLTAFAQKYFEEALFQTEEGKAIAMSYLKERGFSTETIKKFGLGYNPGQWDSFVRHAIANGYKKEQLIKAGLCRESENQLYDIFRSRIIFPVHSISGRVVGFGARILVSDKNRPKYLNSPETDIYQKSKILYGIFHSRTAISRLDNCLLVEGYTDVIALHQAGIENVIASSGTSLTSEQIRLIKRYTSNITLLFDGDPAGIKAAFRGVDMILEEGMNVRLVLFPEGEDPDSYAKKYRPVELQQFVQENTVDFISFKTKLLLSEAQNDPIKKAALIKEIAQTVALVADPITRSIYTQKCSEMLQIDEYLLIDETNRMRRKKALSAVKPITEQDVVIPEIPTPPESVAGKNFTNGFHEKEVIRMLLLYGERILEVDGEDDLGKPVKVPVLVADLVLDDLNADELTFDNEVCQKILEIFSDFKAKGELPPARLFTHHPDEQVRQLTLNLIETPHLLSENWEVKHRIFVKPEAENLKESLLQSLYAFKLKRIDRMIADNQEQLGKQQFDEQQLQFLKNDIELKAKRMQFAAALNRIIP